MNGEFYLLRISDLIGAIERGDDNAVLDINRQLYRYAKSLDEVWPRADVVRAYDGSLDAAKALHDALLPGWEWHIGPSNAKIYPYNGSPMRSWSGMADNPARAWLLATLRAFAVKMGAEHG